MVCVLCVCVGAVGAVRANRRSAASSNGGVSACLFLECGDNLHRPLGDEAVPAADEGVPIRKSRIWLACHHHERETYLSRLVKANTRVAAGYMTIILG